MGPTITEIEITTFEFPLENAGRDEGGFNLVYEPGQEYRRKVLHIQIHTDNDVSGEYVAGGSVELAQIGMFADYLLGKDALARERHWSEIKRGLRKYDRKGIGPIDIALWDLAGKYYGAPIHELLGTYRDRLPTYASTYFGDINGGLDTPDAFADFAEECLELGYPAFKIHGWVGRDLDISREIQTVHAVGNRVGDRMDLMLDPTCEYKTFADALKVGKACDEQEFLWYEDPYRDGGISQHGHRKLREHLETPILQMEHVRGLELHTDFVANGGTDYVRADPDYDAGITGAIKIARMAEGFGLDVEYHSAGPAQRHCMAATRNSNYYELSMVHPNATAVHDFPAYEGNYSDALGNVDKDGTVPVPDGPGLGVSYDRSYIQENAVSNVVYR